MNRNDLEKQQMIDNSRREGRRLSAALSSGVQPQPINVPLALQPGELCYGQMPVAVLQFIEGDGSYVKRSGGFVFGGGLIGAAFNAVNMTANAVGNARRRNEAAREMNGNWRHAQTGQLYLTNRRWSLNANRTWSDWWFNGVRMSHCDGWMIVLELVGQPPTGLLIAQPDYWFVMFHKLAFNTVALPPPPSDEAGMLPPGAPSGGASPDGPGWVQRDPG